jgi:ribosomal protein L11 methyltransferase
MTADRPSSADLQEVLSLVASDNGRITPRLLVHRLYAGGKRSRGEARAVVRRVVDQGLLSYCYILGTSFLELAFTRPVKITDKFVLKPPGTFYLEIHGQKVITIEPGAAFGGGQHPTTRLALKGMTWCFDRYAKFLTGAAAIALDIGTGTGVLAIAAVRCGVHRAIATEVDPCARWEARRNVALNGLSERIVVRSVPSPPLGKNAVMVTANLRLPTLVNLRSEIPKTAAPGAILIFSGIRPEELPQLISAYGAAAFDLLYQETEQSWSCVVFKKLPAA